MAPTGQAKTLPNPQIPSIVTKLSCKRCRRFERDGGFAPVMSGTELFATFLGSVALLLWGVRMVRTGMTRAFGATLRHIAATSTKTWPRAFFAGLGITGLLQSSTATAVLLPSFAARGLVLLPRAAVCVVGAAA